jgi:DnaJ like chaperone protein
MSIWGKIIGGAAGFALGGPLGALIGGVAGHAVDRWADAGAEEAEQGTQQIAFTIGVIALSAKMARADGTVSGAEVAAFRRLFEVPAEEVANVGRMFDLAQQSVDGFDSYARQVARLFPPGSQVLEDLLGALYQIALADRNLHPSEEEYLGAVAEIFGIDAEAVERIRLLHGGLDSADPWQILGVRRDAPLDEVRKSWLRLAAKHHPDRLVGQGMPFELVRQAEQKLARINDAYQRIVKSRQAAAVAT